MSAVEKITVTLPPEMADFVRRAVDAGEYASPGEVISEAMREWKLRRDLLGYPVEELRELVREGIASGPGKHATMADIKAEARRRLDERRAAGTA